MFRGFYLPSLHSVSLCAVNSRYLEKLEVVYPLNFSVCFLTLFLKIWPSRGIDFPQWQLKSHVPSSLKKVFFSSAHFTPNFCSYQLFLEWKRFMENSILPILLPIMQSPFIPSWSSIHWLGPDFHLLKFNNDFELFLWVMKVS